MAIPTFEHPELAPSIIIDSSIHTSSLLLRVMMVLYQYQRTSYGDLQRVIDQQIGKYDLVKQPGDHEESKLSRRDALVMIAGLPLALLVKKPLEPMATAFAEDFLAQCAASMTACWHLMRGNQLSVVEEVLPAYLSTLETLAQQLSKYQSVAANLTAQGYLLMSLSALHNLNLLLRESYCQKAILYSKMAIDHGLEVVALMHLSSTFHYRKEPFQSLQAYLNALQYIDRAPSILHTRMYVGVAQASAQCGQHQEALHYLRLAHEAFSTYGEDHQNILYAEFDFSSLSLWEGLTYLNLHEYLPDRGYHQQAWETFARVREHESSVGIPQRVIVEFNNHQAVTAIALRDMDRFIDRLEKGINGARALNSKIRREEVLNAYKEARKVWPNETRIQALADLFL